MARNTLVQMRRDTAANWTSTNPVLAAGEWGVETDTLKAKIGDGATAWTALGYLLRAADIGVSLQAYDSALQTLATSFSSISAPRRWSDIFRAGPSCTDTTLTGDITSTATSMGVSNVNVTRSGVVEVVGLYDVATGVVEEVLAIRGQGTATVKLVRGVNGTTKAAHTAAGTLVLRSRIRNTVVLGDSVPQGSVASTTGSFDNFVNRLRRIYNERFGGSLGVGFRGWWRCGGSTVDGAVSTNTASEWSLAGTWTKTTAQHRYETGPWAQIVSGASASDIATYTRQPGERISAVDVMWVDLTNALASGAWSWLVPLGVRYSVDGGTTWATSDGTTYIANPDASICPSATTTLAAGDNGRRCDYYDGTKQMVLASTASMPASGYVIADVGAGGGAIKCIGVFSYTSVDDATHLGGVQYVGPAAYNALTLTTSDTVQIRPELRRTRILVEDPATFKVRGANAAGTGKTIVFAGIDIWSTVPVFGVTRGHKLHNMGFDGATVATFMRSRTIGDAGTTNASTALTALTMGVASGALDNGSLLYGTNIPADTCVTAVVSGTAVTMSQNATASVTAGSVNNPVTIRNTKGRMMAFSGCAAAWVPDLVMVMFTNDMQQQLTELGSHPFMTGNIVSGSAALLFTGGAGLQQSDQGATLWTADGIPLGTTLQTFTDNTHGTMSANATVSHTGVGILVYALPATINAGIANNLTNLRALCSFASELVIAPYEQGGVRLDSTQSRSADQATYRAAIRAWALSALVGSLDIDQAWRSEGIAGFAAASADGLIDTGDASGFHVGAVGHPDIAGRISKVLEVF